MIQYVLSKDDINKAKDRLYNLKQTALLSRDAGDVEANREYYLLAKGFEECMTLLGIKTSNYHKEERKWRS